MAAAGAAPLATVSIFSSTSALLGPAGQANYAAANAALGAWADGQHAAGVAAMSVMWGAWAAGMAAVDKVRCSDASVPKCCCCCYVDCTLWRTHATGSIARLGAASTSTGKL